MVRFPFIKINLGLQVLRKRPDGFHDLSTVFYPVRRCADALEIVPAQGAETRLHVHGLEVPGDPEQNLVLKAYRLLAEEHALPPLDIHLIKRIPTGAGVGGGSSDAAHMLLMLNEYCQLNLSEVELVRYAARLGSDCAFFIYGKPMLGTGRGEVLTPVPQLDLSSYYIRIVFPGIHVPTPEAFAGITPKEETDRLELLVQKPVKDWKNFIFNAFEQKVFARHPQLADLKQVLYEDGALYAAMSGSGSAVFGIFDHLPAEEEGWGRYLGKESFVGSLGLT